ncbi:GPI inositol-deacylase [Dirofilaria immitis]
MIGNRPWMRINQCEMTYMYRIMSFMRIDIGIAKLKHNQTEDVRYPFSNDISGYSTILYGEGEYALNYMRTKQVSGLPIIFVPGNAGSCKQVRSLGSILHNKTESRNLPFTFDVFAIDFNEELSGLAGMYLERQIKYLELAVRHIWGMYSSPPHGIIFVGHSMGGIVIRSLLNNIHFDPNRIAFIVTLGTPHKDAPMVFDWYLKNMYNRMHDSWRKQEKELSNLLVLSISGGLKDHLVPEHFTLDNGIRHVSTTAVNGIELETDHLCIVWCNQLVRYISRLMVEYAYDPDSFHIRADNVVKQLFNADGLLKEMTRIRVDTNIKIAIRNELIFIKNSDQDPKEFVLSFPKNSWLFIETSIESSLWTSSGEPIYSLNKLRQSFYTLVHSSVTEQVSVVHIGLLSLLKSCFASLWKANFEGHEPVVLLPVYFGSPAVAVVISLELESCKHANVEWFAKVEFRSQNLRRVSSLGANKKLQIVGHLLSKEETKAETFFILNQHCRFHARLDVSYLDTLVVMLRMYGSIVPYMLAVYILSALSISNLIEIYYSTIRDYKIICFTLIYHMFIIYWNNLVDWFTLLISSLLILSFTYILQKLADLFIQSIKCIYLKRPVKSRFLDINEMAVITTSLFINYLYNGFFAFLIVVIFSLLQLLKTAIFSRTVNLSVFSQPVFLIVLHFYAILVYTPFGICSVWNIIRYGLFAVYEDPARIPAYCMIFLKFIRLLVGKIHFFRAHYISVAVLTCTAIIQPFTCVAQLGFPFIAVIGLSWFVNRRELKPSKED